MRYTYFYPVPYSLFPIPYSLFPAPNAPRVAYGLSPCSLKPITLYLTQLKNAIR
ncbi:MAG: hypothetical protein F6J94_05125 [Moorea sp. SIO1F2]|uniref:hypothetical protein n=1 Tax=Moorena sp. SIO1F2 TaxID=2607819 RepID=UPI0013B69461|nr:hypothetical protein [Moorena sp. SIO1F2]NET81355.1 hypothetical protein [Moorena sp. SIO1F2]